MTRPKIKTRILHLSDTHTATPPNLPSPPPNSTSPPTHHPPFRAPLPSADVALHTGDLTMAGHLHEYEATLAMLSALDAGLKLVIAGNHDISLDEAYYARRGQAVQRLRDADPEVPRRARELWTGERARAAGVVYLEEGRWEFVLGNGARLRVYASPYQPEFCDWAFPYWRHEDRYNPPHQATPNAVPIAVNPVPDFPDIDIMMTHGPPKGVRDETHTDENVGCEHLLRAARRCRPRLHCFGHIHEAWGAERVKWKESEDEMDANGDEVYIESQEWIEVDEDQMAEQKAAYIDVSEGSDRPLEWGKETLMVNASIMTMTYKPWQGAWVVDLDLEKAD